LALRFADLAVRGRLALILRADVFAGFFLLETALLLVPVALLGSRRSRSDPSRLFQAAMLMMLGGGLYRFDTYLVAFTPGEHWSYFPAVPELLFSFGIVAFEIAA
jgi:Ni/Fe-hydrogenase subunit HybB-like protein